MKAETRLILLIDDVTSSDACVNWTLPSGVFRQDITHFSLKLWQDGTFSTMEELNKASKGRIVFNETTIDRKETCYSLHGLQAATVYRIRVSSHFIKSKLERFGDYTACGLKEFKDGSL